MLNILYTQPNFHRVNLEHCNFKHTFLISNKTVDSDQMATDLDPQHYQKMIGLFEQFLERAKIGKKLST